jgi:plastocyanin
MRSTLAVLTLAVIAAVQVAGCNSTTNPGGGGGSNTFDSGGFSGGSMFSHAFGTAGIYTYKCTIHPTCGGLMGTMTVVPAEVTIQPGNHSLSISIGTGGGCYLLSPQVDSVHVGELVTWNNNTAVPHTVTSVTTP